MHGPRVLLVIVALAAAGCTPPAFVRPTPTPVVSSPPRPPAPPQTVPAPTTERAVSALSGGAFEIVLFRRANGGYFQYEPDIELVETTGQHAATILSISVETDNGGTTERDCQPETIRIPAGGRWNLHALGYCAPYAITRAEATQVTFSAFFVDDNGGSGTIQITKSVAGCTLGGRFGSVSCKTDAR